MIGRIFVYGKGIAFIDINDLRSSDMSPCPFSRGFFGEQIKCLFLGKFYRNDILVRAVAVIVVAAVAFEDTESPSSLENADCYGNGIEVWLRGQGEICCEM